MNNKKLFLVCVFVILANSAFASPKAAKPETTPYNAKIEYDRGEKKGLRNYQSVEDCRYHPCVITQWGAIRFNHPLQNDRVEMGALHRGHYVSISLFQESTSLEQKLSERIFNRKPNRKAIDLGHKVEAGQIDILYMYGFLLQYEFDEGDLIAIKLTSLKDPSQTDEYFFRFHQDGAKWDVDIAFVQPIPSFHPNPGDGIQSANSTAAISFSVGKTMDPDRHYSLGGKILRSARFHITIGLLQRREVYPFNGDNITKDFFDGFGGVGFTFFDFLAVGYAANIARSPHTTFPYVGIELRHLLEFIRSLKQDTHSQWEKYLQKENEQNR